MNKTRIQHLLLLTATLLAGRGAWGMEKELEQLHTDYLEKAMVLSEKNPKDDNEEYNKAEQLYLASQKKYNTRLTEICTQSNENTPRSSTLENQYLELQEKTFLSSWCTGRYEDKKTLEKNYQNIFEKNKSLKTVTIEEAMCKKLNGINGKIHYIQQTFTNTGYPNTAKFQKTANFQKIFLGLTAFCTIPTLASLCFTKKTRGWSLMPACFTGTAIFAFITHLLHSKIKKQTDELLCAYYTESIGGKEIHPFLPAKIDKKCRNIKQNIEQLVKQQQKFATSISKKLSVTQKTWNDTTKLLLGSNPFMRWLMPNVNKETRDCIAKVTQQLNKCSTLVNSNLLG